MMLIAQIFLMKHIFIYFYKKPVENGFGIMKLRQDRTKKLNSNQLNLVNVALILSEE